jgi:hypothetical protein
LKCLLPSESTVYVGLQLGAGLDAGAAPVGAAAGDGRAGALGAGGEVAVGFAAGAGVSAVVAVLAGRGAGRSMGKAENSIWGGAAVADVTAEGCGAGGAAVAEVGFSGVCAAGAGTPPSSPALSVEASTDIEAPDRAGPEGDDAGAVRLPEGRGCPDAGADVRNAIVTNTVPRPATTRPPRSAARL